jgi:hypothetical protein
MDSTRFCSTVTQLYPLMHSNVRTRTFVNSYSQKTQYNLIWKKKVIIPASGIRSRCLIIDTLLFIFCIIFRLFLFLYVRFSRLRLLVRRLPIVRLQKAINNTKLRIFHYFGHWVAKSSF